MKRRAFWTELGSDPVLTIRLHTIAIRRLWRARLGLEQKGWQGSLEGTLAFSLGRSINPDELRPVEVALYRASRLMPKATCIHRALALKAILDGRRVSSRIVIGLRKRSDVIEGHAWVEAAGTQSLHVALVTANSGYKEIDDLQRAISLFEAKRKPGP